MVAKLPLVATRCGGYEGLVSDGENGWLVDVGNPRAIADAIEQLAGDPGLRAKLAENARQYAIETFDVSAMLGSYQALYEQLLNDR
jgi:glycosyltransferase involved in cell wall biosynthesis